MPEADDFDICVIGGGPAGSVAAAQLSAYGHRVLLVDKGRGWQRSHVATLPDSVLPLFDALGVREAVESGRLLRTLEIIACWPGLARPREPRLMDVPLLHVDRQKMDLALLEHAHRSGATVLRPATAMEPSRRDEGGWTVRVKSPSIARSISCRLIADASAGRALPGAPPDRSVPATLAVSAAWHTGSGAAEGWVEALDNGWLWSAPIDACTRIVSVFLDAGACGVHKGVGLAQTYHDMVAAAVASRALLAGARGGPVRACPASPLCATQHAGIDFLRVGDSSVALDPLSSQGILNALAGALQAAVVANTMLRRPGSAADAIALYSQRQNQRQEAHRARAAQQYRDGAATFGTPFWRSRAQAGGGPRQHDVPPLPRPGLALDLHPSVRIEDSPAIEGAFVVRRPAVITPSGEAVTTVGPADLPLLLQATSFGTTASELVKAWSRLLPHAAAEALLPWLWSRGMLVPVPASCRS